MLLTNKRKVFFGTNDYYIVVPTHSKISMIQAAQTARAATAARLIVFRMAPPCDTFPCACPDEAARPAVRQAVPDQPRAPLTL